MFVLKPRNVNAYMERYSPVCLRQSVRTPIPEGAAAINFGVCKGLTHERVLIFPTKAIIKFLTKGTALPQKSACGLYVGVTRAIHSVAFVVDKPTGSPLKLWEPGP